MRMETLTRTVYKFNELSERAKEKALEKLSTWNVDNGWWESFYEDAARIGLKITAFDFDRRNLIEGNFSLCASETAAAILKEHGATCDTYKLAEQFLEAWNALGEDNQDSPKADSLVCEFERAIKEEYLHNLRKEYEYLTSETAILETIEANDYEFDELGNLV